MVAFQTSVPYFSAKPTIHCTKEHNSVISREGQMWREREKKKKTEGDLFYPFDCWLLFLNFILKVYIFLHSYIFKIMCLFVSKLQ